MPRNKHLQKKLGETKKNYVAGTTKGKALTHVDDVVLLEQLITKFETQPVERAQMISAAEAKGYAVHPAYLNPETLKTLIALHPEAAIECVRKDHQMNVNAGIHSNKSERNEKLLRMAFQENKDLITEETFKYAYAAAANYLPSIDKEMTLVEELCYSHPHFRQLFRGLSATDFDQRKKDREALSQKLQ